MKVCTQQKLNLVELSNQELIKLEGGFILYYAAAATVLYYAGFGAHWAYDKLLK